MAAASLTKHARTAVCGPQAQLVMARPAAPHLQLRHTARLGALRGLPRRRRRCGAHVARLRLRLNQLRLRATRRNPEPHCHTPASPPHMTRKASLAAACA
jgi:hypothetical protein